MGEGLQVGAGRLGWNQVLGCRQHRKETQKCAPIFAQADAGTSPVVRISAERPLVDLPGEISLAELVELA